jgi:hypothetical protein
MTTRGRRHSYCCTSLLYEGQTGGLSFADHAVELVGVTGFEPAASSSRTKRATKLRHTPWPAGCNRDAASDARD